MPAPPPHIDGLPFWAQIAISLIFGLAALGAAYKGYFSKGDKPAITAAEPQTAAILAASIADMGAIRNLSDCVVRLDTSVVALTRTIGDQTHFERNNNEALNELCARLRELREELERHRK